jgi:hypothetical protein
VPTGGNGVTAVPHDPEAFTSNPELAPRPAFLQTSRAAAELELLRFYSDEGAGAPSSLYRPFLMKEASLALTTNAGGQDSRGIVIDPTPRIACKAKFSPGSPDRETCARLPARVFVANRTPASMIVGEIGESAPASGQPGGQTYDADRLVLFGNVPLSLGPSRLYLAPIVDRNGNLALRVFIVCFDASAIFIYDPDLGVVENIIRAGPGPFAMAFDPFTLDDVALRKPVAKDMSHPEVDLKVYRFAYLASFTNSFVNVIDLDNSRQDKSTFETVVYTLGQPTLPKGTH